MAFMGLKVGDLWNEASDHATIRVKSECSEVNSISFPRWERIHWSVPAHGSQAAVTFTWHHGHPPNYAPRSRNMLGELLLDHGATEDRITRLLPNAGCLIVGKKGILATNSHNTEFTLLPEQRFEHIEKQHPQQMPASPGHYKEWVRACQGESVECISNFGYAAPFAEFLTVGSLSTRFPGEALEFAPQSGKIGNHRGAAELLDYSYRDGWTL